MAAVRVDLWQGDCLDVLRGFPDACIDAVVTDPPYGLSREPDVAEVLTHWLAGEDYEHRGKGFQGKTWDSFVPGPSVWREVLRVLKPGGHVLSFSGTRTYDLMVVAMRLAGFQIRDQLAWMYGTGFAKTKEPGRAIDMELCTLPGRHYDKNLPIESKRREGDHLCPAHVEGDPWRGYGTALSPAQEPIVLARKPLIGTIAANVLEHGTGGINIDGCRVGAETVTINTWDDGSKPFGGGAGHPFTSRESTGRWPANVVLDEDAAAVLDEQTGIQKDGVAVRHRGVSGGVTSIVRPKPAGTPDAGYGGSGGASRFFYVAKVNKAERERGLDHMPVRTGGELTDRVDGSQGLNSPRAGAGRRGGRRNHHPTLKPIALMQWLCRLVTPPGGIVLDPYMGSGSTGCAAKLEGFWFVGIDLDPEYVEIARARIGATEP